MTVMVVIIGLYIPYAGPAMAAISPIPLLLVVLRQGWRVAIQAFIATCLLVSFLTGPFTAFAVLTIALRSFALGIGLRKGWSAGKTVLAGTAFLWAIVWAGVTATALVLPSWRAATEQGITLTYHQLTGLLGLLLRLFGQNHLWQQLSPHLNDFLGWFLAHWLLLLPLFVWPILLIAVGAEYIIVEVVLPRFGVTPPPLRLPLFGNAAAREAAQTGTMRKRIELTLQEKLGHRPEQPLRRSSRRLTPSPVTVRTGSGKDATTADATQRDATGSTGHPLEGGRPAGSNPSPREEITLDR